MYATRGGWCGVGVVGVGGIRVQWFMGCHRLRLITITRDSRHVMVYIPARGADVSGSQHALLYTYAALLPPPPRAFT